jgi:arabinofuranosyltransferase
VAIIDRFGLNDVVIAHSPARSTSQLHRFMAHDRKPPKGYLPCFRQNVQIDDHGKVTVTPREQPLEADEIRKCETRFAKEIE